MTPVDDDGYEPITIRNVIKACVGAAVASALGVGITVLLAVAVVTWHTDTVTWP